MYIHSSNAPPLLTQSNWIHRPELIAVFIELSEKTTLFSSQDIEHIAAQIGEPTERIFEVWLDDELIIGVGDEEQTNTMHQQMFLMTDDGLQFAGAIADPHFKKIIDERKEKTFVFWRRNVESYRSTPSIIGVSFSLYSYGDEVCWRCRDLEGDYRLDALPTIPVPGCTCEATAYRWNAIFKNNPRVSWKTPCG